MVIYLFDRQPHPLVAVIRNWGENPLSAFNHQVFWLSQRELWK